MNEFGQFDTRVLVVTANSGRMDNVRSALDSSRGAIELLWGTFDVRESTSIAAATDLLVSETFDLVLLDANAPTDNGRDSLSEILIASPRSAVVILVSADDDGAALEVLRSGAQDYIADDEINSRTLARTFRGAIERKAADMQVAESRVELIWRLAKAAEYRDSETGNHVMRVSCYAREIGVTLGLGRREIETLFMAAPLHDIGKIGIPDAILRKPGRLTPEEFAVMQKHCEIGARILEDDADVEKSDYTRRVISSGCLGRYDDPIRNMARKIALSHHEKWNGGGYPAGLAGDKIPLEGRIVAICDVFDALLSERPYKRPFCMEDTLEIIRNDRETHFDPAVSDAFEKCLPTLLEVRDELSDSELAEHEEPIVVDQPVSTP